MTDGSMGCRVIIVEDHAESAEGLAELMTSGGYEPHVAGGRTTSAGARRVGRSARGHRRHRPAGMDGYELAGRIRRVSGGSEIFLVALSGASDEDGALHRAGFDHRLVKPVDLDILERLLDAQTRRSDVTTARSR